METVERAPLEVYAVDERMNRATGSIPYRSLRWVRRYTEPGEFEMVVPDGVYDPSWRFVCCDERPETGVIQKVSYSDDESSWGGVDSVTLSGYFLEQVLNRVVFLAESPEQEKVYVPEPRRPIAVKGPRVYTDTVGGTYVEVGDNEVVSLETGRHSTATGLTETPYDEEVVTGGGNPAYSFYDGSGGIVRVDWRGQEQRVTPEFRYGGSAWYRDPQTGRIKRAQAIADKKADAYWVKKKRWDALADDSYGSYYTRTVKGPWQRTDAEAPLAQGDSIALCIDLARRSMGDWLKYEEPDIAGVVRRIDPSFEYLGDLMYSVLGEVGASLRLEYEFAADAFVLSVYRGADRTQEQTGNPWAVFSDTWGTIEGYEAWSDESAYRNTCFVLYEYDEPLEYDSRGWPKARLLDDGSYGVPFAARRGYETVRSGRPDEPAIETYLDLRRTKPSCDREWKRDRVAIPSSPPEKRAEAIAAAEKKFAPPVGARDLRAVYGSYAQELPARGRALLAEKHSVRRVLDAGVSRPEGYLADWDLGDLVEMAVEKVGMVQSGRVVEVEETYEGGRASVSVEIGDAGTKKGRRR